MFKDVRPASAAFPEIYWSVTARPWLRRNAWNVVFDRMLAAIIDQTRNDGNIGVPARNAGRRPAGRAGFRLAAPTAARTRAAFARMRGSARIESK
ncbi:hypothetical protein [Burkholderia cepacia]|uniref:hypothetical protein n=1 Tax=Burkholderia cepacia TaxID=292 RepID=UPI000F5629D6|nr:hypothetical protein [Burkholderia cepacia]HDR9770348.1 hypothetical protein [Burkholderia cepacia ATCC 25416]MCA7996231.1 hypothetical protein [Burkholderia cepacia]MCA8024977.1 hypothetical protein [Burkholderia cepacia]MCA8077518.1 hypothetical protein [Burkholderia cepacia]MCA8347946.1 hypothetical protein [Burkholderia cepacia]